MKSEYQEYLNLATSLAKKVGKRLREVQENSEAFKVSYKAPNDLVTELDVWSEKTITEGILKEFPDHQILGEESHFENSKDDDSKTSKDLEKQFSKGVVWIIDPIDGTTNFVSSIPHVAVSIGILKDGVRVVGVAYDPFRDELFSAALNEGAYLNSKKIQVSKKDKLKKSLVATGYPYKRVKEWPEIAPIYDLFFKESRDLRVFGSAVLNLCWLASGRIDTYFEVGIKPWDVAAGSLIVEEAGGKSGNPLTYDNKSIDKGVFSCFEKTFLFSAADLYGYLETKFEDLLTESS